MADWINTYKYVIFDFERTLDAVATFCSHAKDPFLYPPSIHTQKHHKKTNKRETEVDEIEIVIPIERFTRSGTNRRNYYDGWFLLR